MKELIERLLANDPSLTELDIFDIIESNNIQEEFENWIQEDDENWEALCKALAVSKTVKKLKFGKEGPLHIVTFNSISIVHWNVLFDAITANQSLTNIEFEGLFFNDINIEFFKRFMKSLAENKSINGYFFNNKATNLMDAKHWEAFAILAKNKKIELNMYSGYLDGLNDEDWERLYQTLKNSKLVFLGLQHNSLCEFNPERWQQLCEIIECNPLLKSVDLEANGLGNVVPSQMMQLCQSFSNNKAVVELNMSNNDFIHDTETWKVFCDYLANDKNLIKFTFKYSEKYDPENEYGQVGFCDNYFCDALSKNKTLRVLDLSKNQINELHPAVFKSLMAGILNSNIETLIFDACNLDELCDDSWKVFCEMLANNINLKNLDLWRSILNEDISENKKDNERFELFCQALKRDYLTGKNASLLTHLNLSLGTLIKISTENQKKLYDSLDTCELLNRVVLDGGHEGQEYQNKINNIPIKNTKGIFFAAAHSLIRKPKSDSTVEKKHAHDNKGLNIKLPVLPIDCVDHILSFLPINFLPSKKSAKPATQEKQAQTRQVQAQLLRDAVITAASQRSCILADTEVAKQKSVSLKSQIKI